MTVSCVPCSLVLTVLSLVLTVLSLVLTVLSLVLTVSTRRGHWRERRERSSGACRGHNLVLTVLYAPQFCRDCLIRAIIWP